MNIPSLMNRTVQKIWITLFALLIPFAILAQDEEEDSGKDRRPVRSPFESVHLIDNQTVIVPGKGTFEFDIQHRFGTLGNGTSDLFGMWASSNIRLGLTYSIIDDLSLGIGTTKFNKFVDFNVKYNFLKQTRDWSIPVGLTYYGYAAIDTRSKDIFDTSVQQLSYFHEIIIGTRINSKLSLQISPSFSHFNAVDTLYSNDIVALSVNGRYKFSSQSSIIFGYDYQITKHDISNIDNKELPLPNIGLGIEIATSSHAFQVFISSSQEIMYHKNMAFNTNDFSSGFEGLLIGFNISRLWGF